MTRHDCSSDSKWKGTVRGRLPRSATDCIANGALITVSQRQRDRECTQVRLVKAFTPSCILLVFSFSPTMRWPRVARNSIETDLDVARKDSNDNATQDASSSYDQLTLKSANPTGLSRMFSDAALYEKVLSACPETLKSGVFHFSADDQSLPNCLGGFNQLIGRDLDDAERVVTGKLATLSVNTWASSIDDPFGADTPSEEEERGEISSSDEGEDKKQAPLSAAPSPSDSEEPPSEPKLTPEEVVELFELEFGALAAPGEEKLLLETDAALLRDVIVLVGPPTPSPFTLIHRRFTFSRYCSGRCSPHYTSINVSCIFLNYPAG